MEDNKMADFLLEALLWMKMENFGYSYCSQF